MKRALPFSVNGMAPFLIRLADLCILIGHTSLFGQ